MPIPEWRRPAVRSAAVVAGVGGVLALAGFVYAALQWSTATYCQNPATAPSCSQGAAWDSAFLGNASMLVAVIGLVMTLAGLVAIVWMANSRESPPASLRPSVVRAATGGFAAFCFVCGAPLGWIGPAGRWYCHECGAYR